jgi:hypothetical protein
LRLAQSSRNLLKVCTKKFSEALLREIITIKHNLKS